MATSTYTVGDQASGEQTQTIRCPICVATQKVPLNLPSTAMVTCVKCRRVFKFAWALPLKGERISRIDLEAAKQKQFENFNPSLGARGIVLVILGAILIVVTVSAIGRDLRGPQFVGFYLATLAGLLFGSFLVRSWRDDSLVRWIALAAYETIGLYRIADGMSRGMHKFEILYIMMVVGAVLFFLRSEFLGSDHFGGNSGSGWSSGWASSSCGSSCSTGGGCGSSCGGGGCGGCGSS